MVKYVTLVLKKKISLAKEHSVVVRKNEREREHT